MFKSEFTPNEEAAIELLKIDPEMSVVTKDKDGECYILELVEDCEEDNSKMGATYAQMLKPNYSFDSDKQKETTPCEIIGRIDFELKAMKKNGQEICALVTTDRWAPNSFVRDNLLRFVEGAAKTMNLDAVIISDIAIHKDSDFIPYTNLGYKPTTHKGKTVAMKTELSERKFSNNFEELYDNFEKQIPFGSERA